MSGHQDDARAAAEEVIALVRGGGLLRGGPLGPLEVAYERLDDVKAAIDSLSGAPGDDDDDLDDDEYAWPDLRENTLGRVRGAEHRDGTAAAADALRASLEREIEPYLSRLPAPYVHQLDDLRLDLVEYAVARAFGRENLFTRIFPVYRAGALPCGWRGRYPEGTLLVHVPPAR